MRSSSSETTSSCRPTGITSLTVCLFLLTFHATFFPGREELYKQAVIAKYIRHISILISYFVQVVVGLQLQFVKFDGTLLLFCTDSVLNDNFVLA